MLIVFLIVLFFATQGAWALDNGLALTPPMGWMSWERFRCIIDCQKYPGECISEKLIRDMADQMVEDGYLEAGYEYLMIDDCWLAKTRDSQGKLQADPERFPSGMKNLSDYIHSKGLKFGLYEDYGTLTCEGYPGLKGHLQEDAELFASWGVDYTKVDGCFSEASEMDEGYVDFGKYLKETNRSIVYSCSWPVYQTLEGITPNYSLIAQTCNLWRYYVDIQDSWESVLKIADYIASHQSEINPYIGPGHWNDPDMLIIGNYGLSYFQAKAQMALWAILAAPLFMSHDMREVKPEIKEILLNKGAIEINQDKMGLPATRVYNNRKQKISVWIRPIEPKAHKGSSWALCVLNYGDYGAPVAFSTTLKRIRLTNFDSYAFEEVFDAYKPFKLNASEKFDVRIPPSSAFLFKVTDGASNSQ